MTVLEAKRGGGATAACHSSRWSRGAVATLGMLAIFSPAAAVAAAAGPEWKRVAPGVERVELAGPVDPEFPDAVLHVVRTDPKVAKIGLFSALTEGVNDAPDAPGWAQEKGLVALINAGMFSPDGRPVGFAKSNGEVVNGTPRKDYRATFVADPIDPQLPAAQILDSECDGDVAGTVKKYRVAVQSIRMVSCKRRNTWNRDAKRWSAAFIALDSKGRVLFIHSRYPFTMNALIEKVLAAPLDVQRALYMEGGPEASLVVRGATPADSFVRVGSYETGFNENDRNQEAWALPNVIGVSTRSR